MKKLFLLICFLSVAYIGYSQEYSSTTINKELVTNADLVLRHHEESIRVLNSKKIIYKLKRVITVLNSKGNENIPLDITYNSANTISKISAKIYNKQGILLKKYTRKDMYEYANSYENTLASDLRHLSFSYVPMNYPYTVEYEYTIELNQSLFLPTLYSKPYENCSVEKLHFSIEYPTSNKVYTKLVNTRNSISTVTKDNTTTSIYTDSFLNVRDENTSFILLKLEEFSLYGNTGSLKDWESLGSFYYNLNKNRIDLPIEYRDKILSKVKGITDTIEKIKTLYKLLQDEYRYVSIQLGVGGWQCADATTTCKNGYGDCKALSNLMCAMLDVAGINSYTSLIYANTEKDRVVTDFPMSYFNHVIVCVPLSKDTVWLECTNNMLNFNYLNSYTANKYTLLVKPYKSELIKTPNHVNNSIVSNTYYSIVDGKLAYSINTIYTSDFAEPLYSMIINNNKKEKDDFILKACNLTNSSESALSIVPADIPKVILCAQSNQLNLITKNAKRMYLKLNKSNSTFHNFNTAYDNSSVNSLTLIDTIRITIPENYALESRLLNTNVQSTMGIFEMKSTIDSGLLTIYKSLKINSTKLSKVIRPEYEMLISNYKNNDVEELIFKLKD